MTGCCGSNTLHPPFDNVEARKAMLYLVDQKAILNATFGDPKYYHPDLVDLRLRHADEQ